MTNKTLKKILVPLDGSKNSLRGLKFALIIAKQSGSSIIGLNVYSIPMYVKTLSIRNKIKQKSKEIILHAENMSQINQVSFSGVIKINNNVGNTIISFAESRKVDMIILGSRGPDPEFEIFLGSVSNHVINKSKIPVTVVK